MKAHGLVTPFSDEPELCADVQGGIMELYHDKFVQFLIPVPSEMVAFADIDYIEHGKTQ